MANNILAKLAVLISANTAAFDKNLKQSENNFARFTNTLSRGAKVVGGVFGAMELYQAVKNGVGIMADFEHTMSEVMAITGATGDSFKSLREDALRLGASTKFTSTEVGKLQVAYGRLGFTTKEILNATEATLDLAAATGEDLAKSADVAGSTVRGFALDARETQRVVDVMAASFNQSALGLDNFTESMKYVAPVANAAGATVEETTALLATLADSGIRGSMAGTSLRKIFTDMTKDGRPLKERLAELAAKGITLADSFDEVGRTAQTSLLILANNTEKTDRLTASFQNVQGEAAKMARIMEDNLIGDVEKLSSAWEGLILKIGNTEPMRNAAQGLTALINAISGTPDVEAELHQLANAIGDGIPNVDGFIKKLAEVRKELGKPIDTSASYINFLAEKYKLTSEQANKLYQSILQANKALSFQEKALKQFQDFAERNGYKDLGVAVDDYKQRLYELILAEQVKMGNTDRFQNWHKEQIAAYRRVIDILNEYKQTLQSTGSVPQVQAKAPQSDLTGMGKYQFIPDLEAEGSTNPELRNEQAINEQKEFAAALAEVATSAEFAGHGLIKLDGIVQNGTISTQKWAQAIIDLTPMISNAVSGIADAMGQAMAGVGNFGESILKVVAEFARQLGSAMIAIGVGILKAQAAISNPYTAIAGGVALVALSAAMGAALSSAQSNFNSGGGSSLGRAATENTSRSSIDSRSIIQQIEVGGTVEVNGDKMFILIKNTEAKNAVRRG